MKSEIYFKVLFKRLTKSIRFALFSKEIRLIWLPCQFSLSLPWTLDQYQPNSAEDSQMCHVPLNFVPVWKQTEECPIQESLRCGSNKTAEGHGFCKAAFCAATYWSAKCCANGCGCTERLAGLLVVQWHRPGHQGALILCPLVGVTHRGSPLLFSGLNIDTFREA